MISSAYAATEGHAQSSGLPQFDSSVFASQIFWTVVSFMVLMYLLQRYVIPAINDILDSRGKKISEDLQNAEKARQEAERVLAGYREQVERARQMASATLEEARLEASAIREHALADLTEELAKKKASAVEEIERVRQRAMEEVRDAAVEIAMLATEKLIAKTVTKAKAEEMVKGAVDHLEQNKASLH
ncbi:MAG: F0F1 ATP synthase subunit B [Magnetococcales bacterium]|nr:F0F1 ATP synthase subunit B [Magnetococcales bacterium]